MVLCSEINKNYIQAKKIYMLYDTDYCYSCMIPYDTDVCVYDTDMIQIFLLRHSSCMLQ